MGDKATMNPGGTYVLDEDDEEALEAFSLTSVMRDAAGIVQKQEDKEAPASLDDLDMGFLDSDE